MSDMTDVTTAKVIHLQQERINELLFTMEQGAGELERLLLLTPEGHVRGRMAEVVRMLRQQATPPRKLELVSTADCYQAGSEEELPEWMETTHGEPR